ncbi:uncharacterized protein LOC127598046 [Hippocampus zosterae]|uniref:uncharacterized protein LOC127598046 n=1 Tax=Hippocampus zosterae TaxID=109293 RepID=UPI00223CC1DE|nr:uncharacterized protein LOC127598046 [Hippocampus zosterae]
MSGGVMGYGDERRKAEPPVFFPRLRSSVSPGVPPSRGREAEGRLIELHQGRRSVADYLIEFQILAAQSGYEDRALCGLFRRGLNTQLKDELATRDNSSDLEELIDLSLLLDNRMRERSRERGGGWFPFRHATYRGGSCEMLRAAGSGDHPDPGMLSPGRSRCSLVADVPDRRRDGAGSTIGPGLTAAYKDITPLPVLLNLSHLHSPSTKWTHRIREWGRSCPSVPRSTRSCTPAPFSFVDSVSPSQTTTWAIENCWLCSQPYKKGDTGLRGLRSYSLYTRTIRIWNIPLRQRTELPSGPMGPTINPV